MVVQPKRYKYLHMIIDALNPEADANMQYARKYTTNKPHWYLLQVNLVEWLKMMVGNRRAEEVVDPNLEVKPTTRALKRALLVALRCVDPDSDKRPKMSHVVRMLETDEVPYREVSSHSISYLRVTLTVVC